MDYWAEIRIIDVNDNTPLFSKMKYETSIAENANIDDMVVKVSATDLDSGLGGVVTYTLDDVSEIFLPLPYLRFKFKTEFVCHFLLKHFTLTVGKTVRIREKIVDVRITII